MNNYDDPFEFIREECDDQEGGQNKEHNGDNIFITENYLLTTIENVNPINKWCLHPLYKPGANSELFYQIGFDGENIVTIYGQVGGKLQISRNEVELNTRSLNIQHQAMIQARFLFRKYNLDNYRVIGSNVPRIKEPMLGYTFEESKKCRIPLTLPVAMEYKFDGLRCMFELTDGKVTARSRGGKYYEQYKNICDFLEEFFIYLPPDTMLDTEIYNHGMKREQISSITRTINYNINEASKMLAYIFDVKFPDDPPFETRKDTLEKIFNIFIEDKGIKVEDTPVRLVPYKLVYNEDDIFTFTDEAVSLGYEGGMVKRTLLGAENYKKVEKKKNKINEAFEYCKYKGGRSHRVYKIKNLYDEEGIIIDIVNCKGREKGCAKVTVVDPRGNIVSIRPKGCFEDRRIMYNNRENLIGKLYTYEYTGLTSYGVPDHPRGVGIREDLDDKKIINKMKKYYISKNICLCLEFGEKKCICKRKK